LLARFNNMWNLNVSVIRNPIVSRARRGGTAASVQKKLRYDEFILRIKIIVFPPVTKVWQLP
jgi:hypothetical protein